MTISPTKDDVISNTLSSPPSPPHSSSSLSCITSPVPMLRRDSSSSSCNDDSDSYEISEKSIDSVGDNASTFTNLPSLTSYLPCSSLPSPSSSCLKCSYYRNQPNHVASVTVDVRAPVHIRNEQIISAVTEICCDYQDNHESIDDNNEKKDAGLSVRQLDGGLSNHLFVVSSSSSTFSVLVRIHPDSPSSSSSSSSVDENDILSLINREKENVIMAHLSSQNLAPIYHGRFTNGRIEEFLENVRPLRHDEIMSRTFKSGVASAMADLHRLQNIPGCVLNSSDNVHEEYTGEVVSTIQQWFQLANDVLSVQQEKKQEDKRLVSIFTYLQQEWEWLYSNLFSGATTNSSTHDDKDNGELYSKKAQSFFRQVVFAHMDCQSLNILTPVTKTTDDAPDKEHEQTKEAKEEVGEKHKHGDDENLNKQSLVKLIDFEYAAYNRRAVDIANTFCECCDMNNLCPNYQNEYPSAEDQNDFLHAYVQRVDPDLALLLDRSGGNDGWEIFLKQGQTEIGKHTLVSHLLWAVWSIAQSGDGCDIEFDYVQYAELRVEGYRYFKGRFWESS